MRHGFSLVELSIVLVILGLLTGGILAGQSLIRASELRASSSEITRYTAAANSFRDKYFALPGDLPNAFRFWGATAGCTNVDVNADVNGCNGNGDGLILTGNDDLGESSRAWQHMALAGLIEGSYSGVEGTGTWVPRSRLGQGAWTIKSWNGPGDHGWTGNVPTGRTVTLLLRSTSGLKPEEAWNIDTKLDDGRASSGRIYPHPITPAGCVNGVAWNSSDYVLTSTSATCNLFVTP